MGIKLAIASGKGGTGKTTVSVNLFEIFKERNKGTVQLIDCDVEEPNDHLFFSGAEIRKTIEAYQLIPEIDTSACVFCGKCKEYCEFNAIVVIPAIKFAEVNKTLCHSCGACSVACGFYAIKEVKQPIGNIIFRGGQSSLMLSGELKIGSAMQTMLIKQLKSHMYDADITLYDAPPGTSCPVVETVSDADYVVLVTEPTPFGLYDLKLTIELMNDLKKKFGVIINKSGIGDSETYDYLKEKSIDILGEIPFSREYASRYASADILKDMPQEILDSYYNIVENIEKRMR